ncbi:MAG: hypothetical protein VYD90_01555 [Pseudomonadota bacterium]|nr:hypothetical protein [Pseudomonadota bacterium]
MRLEVEALLGDGDVQRGRDLLKQELQALELPVRRFEERHAALLFAAGVLGVLSIVALVRVLLGADNEALALAVLAVTASATTLAMLVAAWAPSLLQFGSLPLEAERWVPTWCTEWVVSWFDFGDLSFSRVVRDYLERFATGERTAYDRSGDALSASLFSGRLAPFVLAASPHMWRWVRGQNGTRLTSEVYVQVLTGGDPEEAGSLQESSSEPQHFLATGSFALFERNRDRFVSARIALPLQDHVRRILTIARRELRDGEYHGWQETVLRAVDAEFNGRIPYGLGEGTIRKFLNGTYGKDMRTFFAQD